MCAQMTAHHAPCAHTHHWLARCFRAKMKGQQTCGMWPLLHFIYTEAFLCPVCWEALKALVVDVY